MSMFRYVSHPEVQIDPAVPVPQWGLSQVGRGRVQRLLSQPWLAAVGRVISSPETKAAETASIIAEHLGIGVEIRQHSGEIDRSATGFVAAPRHEALANRFFADPHHSAEGWERAVDAQHRLVTALADVLLAPDGESPDGGPSDVVVVGHGGVGTLLYCHLARLGIDRRYDQPGQGNYWTYDRRSGRTLHPWRPIS